MLAPYPRHRFKLTPDDSHLPYATVRHIRFWSTWRKLRWYRYWLLRLHRSFPFDVLHCQSVYPCGYLGALCKDNLDFALVITSHGGCLEPASTYRQKPGAMQRYALAAERADMLVSISRFTRDAMRQFARRPDHRYSQRRRLAEYEVSHERPPQLVRRFKPANTCCSWGVCTPARASICCWKRGPESPCGGRPRTCWSSRATGRTPPAGRAAQRPGYRRRRSFRGGGRRCDESLAFAKHPLRLRPLAGLGSVPAGGPRGIRRGKTGLGNPGSGLGQLARAGHAGMAVAARVAVRPRRSASRPPCRLPPKKPAGSATAPSTSPENIVGTRLPRVTWKSSATGSTTPPVRVRANREGPGCPAPARN